MSPPRCCVLGATGFIGGQIVRAALARGWAVRGVRRRPDAVGALEDIADQIEWAQADLADPASLVAAMNGCPLVFHAAAYYPLKARDAWEAVRHGVREMRHVLTAARSAQVKRLVYTSSLSTVGPPSAPGRLANEDDLYLPGSVGTPYFEVKWAMEQEALRAAATGLDVVVTIPTTVLGPGDIKPTTSQIVIMVARRRLRWAVEGSINVIDGRDLAHGHILAAGYGKSGRRYILGGANMTVREMLTTIAEAAGVPPPRTVLSPRLIEQAGRMGSLLGIPAAGQLQAMRHWQPLDTSRAQAELNIPPARPFAETCHDTLAWFRARGLLPAQETATARSNS